MAWKRAAFILMLAMTPVGAAAQYGSPMTPPPPPPQNSMGQDRVQPNQPAAPPADRATVYRAAACLVGRDAEAASRFLTTMPFSDAEARQARNLVRAAQRCIRADALPTNAMVFRAGLAEALYETQFATPAAVRTPALAARPEQLHVGANPQIATLQPTVAAAECVAAAQPDAVRTFLASEVGTEAERTALQGLNAHYFRCIARGSRVNADMTIFRWTLAEALYRWSVVQRDGTASAWAAPPAATAAAPGGQ